MPLGTRRADVPHLSCNTCTYRKEERMNNEATNYGGRSERGGGSVRGVVGHNLDAVESGVDTAIDGAKDVVHEFRGKAQEFADAMLDRVNRSWQQQLPR